ncbi:hypothetical protein PoB_007278200 [Plakobranchus ocellatus]|uniref:Uncharacterized protein n=1 Tax=Plakobranchus ocellatus TaxID=259542 RepID=A0AAV4DPK9_9GAST|nr:hypothetical protein PoB_007278200 [Plakobranchus ocellatus]
MLYGLNLHIARSAICQDTESNLDPRLQSATEIPNFFVISATWSLHIAISHQLVVLQISYRPQLCRDPPVGNSSPASSALARSRA